MTAELLLRFFSVNKIKIILKNLTFKNHNCDQQKHFEGCFFTAKALFDQKLIHKSMLAQKKSDKCS